MAPVSMNRLCSFHYAYTTGILLQAICSHAKPREGEIFNRSRSAFTKVFQPKNNTAGIGKDKEKDFGSFEGISSLEIAEKVTFGPGGMTDCASLENTIEDQVDEGICKKKKNKRKKKKNKKGKKAEPQEKRLKLENNE
ncbi:uncharacterized protein [Montipora capricornis]|uniref:uncharacterized protein n=1 Tax=Montipora capricornis TaxID=246305 RepID=UPI0035F20413